MIEGNRAGDIMREERVGGKKDGEGSLVERTGRGDAMKEEK